MSDPELGRAADTSQRMVARYENTPGVQPSADVVVAPASEDVGSPTYRLRKRLRKVEQLPPDDQKTVVNIVEALVAKRALTKETG